MSDPFESIWVICGQQFVDICGQFLTMMTKVDFGSLFVNFVVVKLGHF